MFKDINENIIKILGIDALPEKDQMETMERLGALVYQEVMLRVLDLMDEEDKDAFEKLIDQNPDPEAMFTYLAEKVPNLDEIVKEEAQKIRDESAEIMSQIGQ